MIGLSGQVNHEINLSHHFPEPTVLNRSFFGGDNLGFSRQTLAKMSPRSLFSQYIVKQIENVVASVILKNLTGQIRQVPRRVPEKVNTVWYIQRNARSEKRL